MANDQIYITVFYDVACPKCVKDRRFYERLTGQGGKHVKWFDITGQDEYLKSLAIDPLKAFSELHLQLSNARVLSELDAYIVLMERVWLLKCVAWLISITLTYHYLSNTYHIKVQNRLKETGRI